VKGLAVRGAVVVVATVLAVAAVASAGGESGPTKRGNCPETFCVFTANDFTGQEVDVTKIGLSNEVDNKIPGQAASVMNDRSGATFFYAKRNGKGRTMCINSGDVLSHLAEVQLEGFASTRLVERRSCFRHH
jgi:hypothetical protein